MGVAELRVFAFGKFAQPWSHKSKPAVRNVPAPAVDPLSRGALRADTAEADKGLEGLLQAVVKRAGLSRGVDVSALAVALQDRLLGLELNLVEPKLSSELEQCLKAFRREDWSALQSVFSRKGGEGIAYLEIDAALLRHALPGLQQLPNLACVSVKVDGHSGTLDFGALKGKHDSLKINILGAPAAALNIIVAEGLSVEAKEGWHASVRQSQVRTRDSAGVVSEKSVPLAVERVMPRVEPPLPCVGDVALHRTLVAFFEGVALKPQLENVAFDPAAVATALVGCGRFDAWGDFGFDLKQLTPQQVRCVQALPPQAWLALQHSAEQAGEDITWLHLHDAFSVNADLVVSLNQLSPLSRLSVATPPRGIYLGLGKLQGGAARLRELEVRCAPWKKWTISVPVGVEVQPSVQPGPDDAALSQSRVVFENKLGETAAECLLFQPPT